MSRRLIIADFLVAALVLAIGATSAFWNRDPLPLLSLILSVAVAYLATIRPHLRRPKLLVALDEIRCSAPTISEDSPSWFVRLRVTNSGLSAAVNCSARLLAVCTASGIRLEKFDPLTLYWARQDRHTGHKPLQIQGQGDVEFLDLLQAKSGSITPITLRTAIPEPMTLARGADDSPSPGTAACLRPGKYLFQVGVFSDNTDPALRWIEVQCRDSFPRDCTGPSPCAVRFVRPPRTKSPSPY